MATTTTTPKGFLEICKEADGPGVSGSFAFTVNGRVYSVPVGACSPAIQVPAGTVTVTEAALSNFEVTGIRTAITGRLVSADPGHRTAQVTVVAGDVSTETIVFFKNKFVPPSTGQLKICKLLGADSGITTGTIFTFTADGHTVNVPAGACVIVGTFDTGTHVTIDEQTPSDIDVTSISVDPSGRIVGSANLATGTVTVSIGGGVTEVSFTNKRRPPPPPAQLTVVKVCDPATDSGRFNLRIDGTVVASNVACGHSSGAITVSPGSHTVSETAGTGTDLANYTTTISCDGAATATVNVGAGEHKVCTITNTRKQVPTPQTGTLTVNKVCDPASDPGRFNLLIDGTAAATNVACGHGTGAVTVDAGNHTVGETAGAGTDLSNYTTTISCDGAPTATVNVGVGQNKTCTITNRHKAETAPPICIVNFVGLNTIQVTVQDLDSGIATIHVDVPPTSNVDVTPTFTPGTTAPVVVTATRINRGEAARLQLTITDRAGNSVTCDPVLGTLKIGRNGQAVHSFTRLAQSESKVTVQSLRRGGRRSVVIDVNGRIVKTIMLRGRHLELVDVKAFMRPGSRNTITVWATGNARGPVAVSISD